MKEIQKYDNRDEIVKYKKHLYISNATKSKFRNIFQNIYELLKFGIIFCLIVLLAREPLLIKIAIAPFIAIFKPVFTFIGIILFIILFLTFI